MKTDDVKVNCNGCTHCCRREAIILVPGDDVRLFGGADVVNAKNPYGDEPFTRVLRHQPNGACVFLGMHGCSVYAFRPMMCRVFSCVGFVRKALAEMSANGIRKKLKRGDWDAETWAAGMARLNDDAEAA